jgi:hypothetical protein
MIMGEKRKKEKKLKYASRCKSHLLQDMLCWDIIQKSGQATATSRSPQRPEKKTQKRELKRQRRRE